jgi:hypothetical protein
MQMSVPSGACGYTKGARCCSRSASIAASPACWGRGWAGVVLVEIAGASGAEVENVLGAGLPGALALLGGLAFLIGLILFGAATMRAGVFPRWAGILLIVGDVVFGLGSFAGSAATIFEIVGASITCVALLWLGLSLLSGNDASAAGQPTRVS